MKIAYIAYTPTLERGFTGVTSFRSRGVVCKKQIVDGRMLQLVSGLPYQVDQASSRSVDQASTLSAWDYDTGLRCLVRSLSAPSRQNGRRGAEQPVRSSVSSLLLARPRPGRGLMVSLIAEQAALQCRHVGYVGSFLP